MKIIKDKIFIEKGERTRLIIEQGIGDKIFEELRKIYKVSIFKSKYSDDRIIFIEEKENEKE